MHLISPGNPETPRIEPKTDIFIFPFFHVFFVITEKTSNQRFPSYKRQSKKRNAARAIALDRNPADVHNMSSTSHKSEPNNQKCHARPHICAEAYDHGVFPVRGITLREKAKASALRVIMDAFNISREP